MKVILICLLTTGFLCGFTSTQDNVNTNIPEKISSYYTPVIDCLLERGPCLPLSDFLATALPDYFKSKLDGYNFEEIVLLRTHSHNIREYFPREWELIKLKSLKELKEEQAKQSLKDNCNRTHHRPKHQKKEMYSNDEFSLLAADSFISNNFTSFIKLYKDLIYDFVLYGDCLICNENSFKWLNDIKSVLEAKYPNHLRRDLMNKHRNS
ncbi:uncharacterized protein LOC130676643 [Microplitis mediator]|uniref:uncharacterized protein LOC130676643 n=1 Tax=Microplitis mediator TaxID=375433 RepID=UPI0025542358|nr:uncharacterized protein LOC130676643 [Microplitis mediator]